MDPTDTPAPEQAAPDTPAPETTEPEIDWQKRYVELQPEYTRTTQELAQVRKLLDGDDPEALKAVLDKYGYQLDDEPESEPDTTEPPEIAELRKELADLKTAQEKDGKSLKQINDERAEKAFDTDLKAAAGDREVSSKARDWISQRTAATGNNPEALANATKEWFEFEDTLRTPQQRRPRAPHVPTGGHAATGGKDPADMNRQEFNAYVAERFQAETA